MRVWFGWGWYRIRIFGPQFGINWTRNHFFGSRGTRCARSRAARRLCLCSRPNSWVARSWIHYSGKILGFPRKSGCSACCVQNLCPKAVWIARLDVSIVFGFPLFVAPAPGLEEGAMEKEGRLISRIRRRLLYTRELEATLSWRIWIVLRKVYSVPARGCFGLSWLQQEQWLTLFFQGTVYY